MVDVCKHVEWCVYLSSWLRVKCVLLFEVELKKELFCVRIPFRPEPIFPFVNLTTWNLEHEKVFRVNIITNIC